MGFGDLEIEAHPRASCSTVTRVTVAWTFSGCAHITHSLNKDGTLSVDWHCSKHIKVLTNYILLAVHR